MAKALKHVDKYAWGAEGTAKILDLLIANYVGSF